ncbi:O-antigen ligase family protein (plasmid) [Sphingomonas sp. CJ20]
MRTHLPFLKSFRPSLYQILLVLLLVTLGIAGGASRADAFGQVVVRGVAWSLAVIAIFLGQRPHLGTAKPVLLFLVAALGLTLVQLIPLPPAIWQALPGRALFAEAATAIGQPQPWRPWSLVPDATKNAASSLVVPLVVLLLVAGLKDSERRWLPATLLSLIFALALTGLVQFSGGGFTNPLVNDTAGTVSGTFANRNHFALLLAIGCLVAPVWAFLGDRRPQWRGPVALGMVLLFALTILATGSRTGLVLGVLGTGLGLVLAQDGIRRSLRHKPRWVFPALVVGVIGVIVLFALVSVAMDRAVSITRLLALDPGQDMRSRGLPTVLEMVRQYFPFGAGLGSFDPVFRIHEPFALLKPTYFNHAHNDWLEIVQDAGLAGLLLLLVGLGWWAWATLRAWRAGRGMRHALPKLGSAILLLIYIASAFDYPARTPTMMAVIAIAAIWLSAAMAPHSTPALPERGLVL